jgi:hypothetical protein
VTIALAFDGWPTLTAHEATGLALLLGTLGSPAATELAGKLRRAADEAQDHRAEIVLTDPEKEALLEVLEQLRPDLRPARLIKVETELAIDLTQDFHREET